MGCQPERKGCAGVEGREVRKKMPVWAAQLFPRPDLYPLSSTLSAPHFTSTAAPPFRADSYMARMIATALRASGPHVSASRFSSQAVRMACMFRPCRSSATSVLLDPPPELLVWMPDLAKIALYSSSPPCALILAATVSVGG